MTEEIIEMVRQAGLAHFYDSEGQCTGITDADLVTAEKEKNDARLVEMLKPFAKLVAAKEREACATIAIDGCLVPPDGGSPTEDERLLCEHIAHSIRVRGNP